MGNIVIIVFLSADRDKNFPKQDQLTISASQIKLSFKDHLILNHTVFKYAGSARLMGKSGGCGT
jgi:hypothetical protein